MRQKRRLNALTPRKMPDTTSGSSHPFIIPIFLSNAACPHRCVFCNQKDVTGVGQPLCTLEKLNRTILRYLSYKGPNRSPVQVSFYGGNFLGLDKANIHRLLSETEKFVSAGQIDGIRFSTRPDTINADRLDVLKNYPVSTIELGVQSMNDAVLTLSERGHTALDTERAVELLKSRGYEIGLQMMVGLPGDDEAGAMDTGRAIADLAPDFVRIYPTVVLKHSLLAGWYQYGTYTPLPLDRCVTLVKQLYLLFTEKQIPVVRMGLQSSVELAPGSSLVSGPFHPAFGHLVHSEIFYDRTASKLTAEPHLPNAVTISVHPRSIPKLRGLKNRNIDQLKRQFNIDTIRIVPDDSLSEDEVEVYLAA